MVDRSPQHATPRPDASLESIARAVSDVSIVVDDANVVVDVSHSMDLPPASDIAGWRGRTLEDIVAETSRPTLRRTLRLVRDARPAPRVDVRHVLGDRSELPVRYTALMLGRDGHVGLFGRDRREEADLRARLLANRQSLERSSRLQRQSDAQYRLLFETASAPLIVVDAQTGKVRDANPRAAALFGATPADLAGRRLSTIVARGEQSEVTAMLAGVVASGAPLSVETRTAAGDAVRLEAELFRAGELKLVMVRLGSPDRQDERASAHSAGLDALLRQAPDAIALTDDAGAAIWANEAFLNLAGIPLLTHLIGRKLDTLFQWQAPEQELALQNARRSGSVSAFAAVLRAAHGTLVEVEMSVVALREPTPGFGFVLRAAPDGVPPRDRASGDLRRTAEDLVDMVGRVPLKDMVRDTTDLIERMCIEAALRLTGNNRASAARALGLSRQAFYLKLNRFGITGDE